MIFTHFTHPPSHQYVLYIHEFVFMVFFFSQKKFICMNWDQTVFVFLWVISLSIMPSRSIHVVAYVRISILLRLESILLYGYVPHFVYLFVSWWVVSTFAVFWIMLLWTSMYTFLCEPVFSSPGYIARSGIAGSCGNSLFNFWGTANCFPKWVNNFTFLPVIEFQFLYVLTSICYFPCSFF